VFPNIPYLSWIEGRPEAVAHDLASSDLRPATLPTEPVPVRLREHADPPEDVTLDALLADAYDVEVDEVLVTAGATNANALAFAVAAEAPETVTSAIEETADDGPDGDADDDEWTSRVLVEKPGYEPHTATPRGFGVIVDQFQRPEGILDAVRVDAAIQDATALVVVSDRHNPTGRRTNRDALRESVAAATDAGARVLVDEVYAHYATAPEPGPFGAPTAAELDGTVVTGSLTKFLGFGGLRIGWLVADAEFVSAAERVQRHFPGIAEPSRQLARRALASHDALAAPQRERIKRNHDLLADFVADRPRLAGVVYDGVTYALVQHDDLDGDELAERALDAGVLVVPGRFFNRPEYVRISLGRPTEQAGAALDALANVLDDV